MEEQMRRELVIALAAVISLSACDPAYTIGARVRLGPPTPDSCVLASMQQSFGRAPFEAVGFHPDAQYSIRVPITHPYSLEWWEANSAVSIERQKDSVLLVELTTSWYGTAAKVPPAEQRRFVAAARSEEHTSELQSRRDLVCRLLLEKKKRLT